MNPNFQNKIAVVTGAGGTICSTVAIELAKSGVKVALIGRTREKLEKVAAQIEANGGICAIYACDVTNEPGIQQIADDIKAKWGLCDFLVNGAGGNNQLAMTTETAFTEEDLGETEKRNFFNLNMDVFSDVLKINTVGTVIPSRVFGRQMAEKKCGAIVNFASMNTYCPLTRVSAYAMSKAAVANFTQWLGAYFAPAGIRVNAVAPGFIVNERSKNYLGTVETGLTPRGEKVIGHTPAGRFGQAQDLVGCVEWLLDDEKSAFVTGITVPVDGGFLSLSGV